MSDERIKKEDLTKAELKAAAALEGPMLRYMEYKRKETAHTRSKHRRAKEKRCKQPLSPLRPKVKKSDFDLRLTWVKATKEKYPRAAAFVRQKLLDKRSARGYKKAGREGLKAVRKNIEHPPIDPEASLASIKENVAEFEEAEGMIARRELAQREMARRRLLASVLRFNPDYLPGWVHKDICLRLERFMRAVEIKENPRLMLQMPPRHGKTTLASQEFPAFVFGHHPDWDIIACSYAESLALDFSRVVRERLRDPEYQVLWPETRMNPDSQNAQGWNTTKKGRFLPAGVGGPITGKGAHILIIDDPVKNAQEAESETSRAGIVHWYESTAYTRLAPGGGVLVIQTRWHLDDLSGRLEANMRADKGDQFEIVRYPAVAIEDEVHRKRGEPLHKERYDLKQLRMIRKAVGERTWAALYQQNPVPDEGAHFQQSMIKYYRKADLPEQLTKMAAWDLAIGQKEVNDKTVGFTWGKDLVGQFWLVDCRHGHFDAFEIVNEICDGYSKHKPYTVAIEKDKVALAVGPLLDTVITDRELYGLHITELRPAQEGNKIKRARTLQGLMRRGQVWLPHPDEAEWVNELVTELLQFPYGRRDDHVDSLAWLALMATETPAPGVNYSKVKKRASWRDRLRHMGRESRTMMTS